MNYDTSSLCCCEYYNKKHERSHILTCCCDCVDLDEAFESLITCKTVSQKNKRGIISTMQNRFRIPWKGGAKQIAFDAILPVIIVPSMLLLASISLWWTFFSFTTVAMFILFISNFLIRAVHHTKFFLVWTITSVIVLYIIFEFIVIPFLEILLEENIALSFFILGFVICLYLMKIKIKSILYPIRENDAENGMLERNNQQFSHCSICQFNIPEKDHHCVWFDCCIGKHNQCLFVLAMFFAITALLYSSNLTLTSVCHPFTLYKTILLPDDCSEVYKLFELSLSFVAAVYSLILAALLSVVFLQQILLISLGVTFREWNRLPLMKKLCLGLTMERPNSRGIYRNWKLVMCWTGINHSILNQV